MGAHTFTTEEEPATGVIWPELDDDLEPDADWIEYRNWWQPRLGKSFRARTSGHVRWVTAWSRRGLARKIQRYLTFRSRGYRLAEQWLSEPVPMAKLELVREIRTSEAPTEVIPIS